MAPKARVQKRLYYKIGEACKALGIQPYVLRYWETEFPALSPSKSRSGQRVYSEKELEVIRRIKQLLYDEGYTIAGAKKKLEGELAAGVLGEPTAGPGTLAAPGALAAAPSPPAAAAAQAAPSSRPSAPLLVPPPGDEAAEAESADAASRGAAKPAIGGSVAGAGSGAPLRTVPLPLVARVSGGASSGASSASLPAIQGTRGTQETREVQETRETTSAIGRPDQAAPSTREPPSEEPPAAELPVVESPVVEGSAEGLASSARASMAAIPAAALAPAARSPAAVAGEAVEVAEGKVEKGGSPAVAPGGPSREVAPSLPLVAPESRQETTAAAAAKLDDGPDHGDEGKDAGWARPAEARHSGGWPDGSGGDVVSAASGAAAGALDTSATKQIETVRSGIERALERARQILALLDSSTPQ